MDSFDLTPIERGVLFILSAEARPLKESAEIKKIHRLAMKKSHRLKLQDLGLIASSPKPFTHELTEKGRKWTKEQFNNTESYSRGLVASHAVIAVIRRRVEQAGLCLDELLENGENRGGQKRRVANAAWSEADEALGEALQEIPHFTEAISQLKATDGNEDSEEARLAANLVLQSIRHAARKRELHLGPPAGSETSFDPVMYYSDDALKVGERVRVLKPPVIRGHGEASVVVRVGEATAIK